MSALPPALAPWAAQLSELDPELAVTIGGWARRIAAALGPVGGSRAGAGQPDGLAGLARRGPYERLLVSEWLVAQELPDEFLRRAAAGEHLFLERGVRTPQGERRSVALLDAGPDQLGTPRLAQLAFLVVLSARAATTRVRFEWGVAQDPAGGLVEGFGPDPARRFLAARSPRPPRAEDLRAWDELILPSGGDDDRWWVGGPVLDALAPPRCGRSRILDVVDPGVRLVRIELIRAGARRQVDLPLPPPAQCTRLFRDPFSAAVASPQGLDGEIVPEAGPLWAPNGRRLAVRLGDGAVFDVHVPPSPREPPGRPWFHRADALVGFGWLRKRQALLASRISPEELALEMGDGTRRLLRAERPAVIPAAAGLREPVALCFAWPDPSQLWLRHSTGSLLWHPTHGTAVVREISDGVAAVVVEKNALSYVRRLPGGELELLVQPRVGRSRSLPLGAGTGRAYLVAHGGRVHVAHEQADGTWATGSIGRELEDDRPLRRGWTLRPPSGTTVVGVVPEGVDLGLLLLEEDQRDFTLLSKRGPRLVHGSDARVVSAATSPVGAVFAYTTRTGELVAFSVKHAAPVLRIVPKGTGLPAPSGRSAA